MRFLPGAMSKDYVSREVLFQTPTRNRNSLGKPWSTSAEKTNGSRGWGGFLKTTDGGTRTHTPEGIRF